MTVGKRLPIYWAVREAGEVTEEGETPKVPVAMIQRNGSGSRPPDDLAVLPPEVFMALAQAVDRSMG